jgi:hypothetical protein
MEMISQLHALAALSPTKECPVPTEQKVQVDGLQSRSRRFEKEKNLLPLPRIEPRFLGGPARRLDTVTAMLSRLPKEYSVITNTKEDG